FPRILSGDYSYAAEPIPEHLLGARSLAGAMLLSVLPVLGAAAYVLALLDEKRGEIEKACIAVVAAIALVWIPVAYFPHSNIPIVLPTVRAERFWYLSAAGVALLLGPILTALVRRPMILGVKNLGAVLVTVFLVFQGTRARMHALDYADDLVFWRAT